jgi:uncharacterized protein
MKSPQAPFGKEGLGMSYEWQAKERSGMELQERIDQALKEAIREQSENKRNAIRLLLTAIKVKEKEHKRVLNESEIQQVVASQIKQRRDSVDQYLAAKRADRAAVEEDEIRILQAFLPEALTTDTLERFVTEAIAEVGAQSVKDMGKVMKALMPKVTGRADGKQVNELVRAKLPR